MKKFLPYIFLLIPFSLLSQESQQENESLIIRSREAEYNGKEIALTGDVVIQHEIGRIAAQRLTLVPSADKNKKMKCSEIKMEKDVILDLHGGGQLRCQQAAIDCVRLYANFLGSPTEPDVVYTDVRKTIPLEIKSLEVKAELMQQHDESKDSDQTALRYIQAEGNVRAYYNKDYTILADKAFYQRLPSENLSSGILFLSVADPDVRSCEVIHKNGDHLKADQIRIHTVKRQLLCYHPKGTLTLNVAQQVQFVCQQLIWDDAKQQLILQNQVEIQQPGVGKITTHKEIRIVQHTVEGIKAIQSIFAPEETELTYVDAEKKMVHKLVCHGPLTIDHEHSQALLQSHADSEGHIPQNQQVYFEDIMGEVYADCMQLNYEAADHQLTPSKVTMTGHVKMFNRFDGHLEESSSVLQYALADIVEYYPNTKEMVLTGQGGQRVLFYDKVNNVQMSAPALKVTRDENHPKGLIQGSGDVRFTFIDKELNQLRQNFELPKQE